MIVQPLILAFLLTDFLNLILRFDVVYGHVLDWQWEAGGRGGKGTKGDPRETRHWRPGPAEKPVLCNACGSRWRIRGTLQNYIPRHARETQSNQLPAEMNPRLLTRDNQRLQVGVEASGQEGSSACLEEEMNSIPSLVSAGSSSVNCMQMEETNDKDPFWNPNNVPKRKRSERRQRILSPVERLQRQLYNNLQELEFENIPDGDEDVTLIYARNKYIPPNEIGLGAMLLVSPTTTTDRSTFQFSMAEDNASSSMNVPVENPYLVRGTFRFIGWNFHELDMANSAF
ncbi:hypothetical protein MTR67_005885 [Solanum verrucosum]|uniref:GATA-type domain-containing protein n=1 Tax=Solanum verrucosum TaxID=315347 RepID=A0AAF0PZ85_SOLVR|nr:hypothetical protein MTR67_005885 [Solanum verrucosum]